MDEIDQELLKEIQRLCGKYPHERICDAFTLTLIKIAYDNEAPKDHFMNYINTGWDFYGKFGIC